MEVKKVLARLFHHTLPQLLHKHTLHKSDHQGANRHLFLRNPLTKIIFSF
jgi:hypothetical protein